MKLTWKIGLLLLTLFIAVTVPLNLTIDKLVTGLFTAHIARELEEEGRKMSAAMADDQQEHLQHLIRTLDEVSVHAYLLIDEQGNQVLSTAYASHPHRLEEVLAGQSVSFEDREEGLPPQYVVGYPILGTEREVHGGLFLFASLDPVDEALQRFHLLMLSIGGGALALSGLLSWGFARRLAGPLLNMKNVTRSLAARRYDARVDVSSQDEIGQLGESINELGTRLQYHEEMRNEFLANVTHELRTPLSYIQGYSQVLEEDWVQDEEERQRYLALIVRETHRLQRLVNDLADLTELQGEGFDMVMGPLDMTAVVDDTLEKMRPVANEKGVELALVHVPPSQAERPFFVQGDPDRLEQVLINLLHNAVRYTEAGGRVEVRLLPQRERELRVEVRDTGSGIPSADLPYLFERFYRVDKSRNRERGGMGLGLSIVKQIVERHGGRVEVESAEGVGTTFSFTLPLTANHIFPGK